MPGRSDHRLAVVLEELEDTPSGQETYLALEVICFPGSYAGLKERPFYDDIVEKLLPKK